MLFTLDLGLRMFKRQAVSKLILLPNIPVYIWFVKKKSVGKN